MDMEEISPSTHTLIYSEDGNIFVANGETLLQNKTSGDLIYIPLNKEIRKIFNIPQDSLKTTKPLDEDDASSTDNENNKIWGRGNVNFLIETIEKFSNRLDCEVKKNVYEDIAKICTQEFHKKCTYKQIEAKWKSLKRTYKSVLLHNNTSGKQTRYWEFFSKMHNFMHKRPEIIPQATCSSSTGLSVNKEIEKSKETHLETHANQNGDTPSSSEHETSFMKKRKLRETEVMKRHKEKCLDWIGLMISLKTWLQKCSQKIY